MPKPSILMVDDNPDEIAGTKSALADMATVDVRVPDDVTKTHLADADLVLIDYRLEHWPERDALDAIALQPIDGLALAGILRSHSESSKRAHSPTAFAILSGHLTDLSGTLTPEAREHVIARSHNLEWVFQKNSDSLKLVRQFVSLASAVQQLPEAWPESSPEATLSLIIKLFSMPDENWRGRALGDVESCHPPLHELSQWSHGLELIRWFLHRILPYPCFLWDTYRLAARLRVSHRSLLAALEKNTVFTNLLNAIEYKGMLGGFLGRRWWRAGVESALWELTNHDPFSVEVLRKALSGVSQGELEPSSENDPVICLDGNFRTLDTFCEPGLAVRLQPDDWPPYADQAWTSMELARGVPRLRAIVMDQDRDRLDTHN